MRKIILVALLPLFACSQHSKSADAADAAPGSLSGSAPGSGTATSRLYDLRGFTAVQLRGSDDVDVRVGSGFSVRAEGPAAQLDRLRITRDGDALEIDRKPGSGLHWGETGGVKVFVTMPRIAAADVVGSGDLAIDRIEGGTFRLGSRGSGDVAIGALSVESADLTIAGSGALTARGDVRRLAIDASGAGDVDAAGLKAQAAKVSVAGTGDVRVTVAGAAQVSASGTGDVDLGAGARCTISATGTGAVRCG